MIERTDEIAPDPMEPGLRILAEMLENSARVRRLRVVQAPDGGDEEGSPDA